MPSNELILQPELRVAFLNKKGKNRLSSFGTRMIWDKFVRRDIYLEAIKDLGDEYINHKLSFVNTNSKFCILKVYGGCIMNENYGEQIKSYRTKLGLTQSRVAEELEVTPGYISNVENGRTAMSLRILMYYAKMMNITLDELVGSLEPAYKSSSLDNSLTSEIKIFSPANPSIVIVGIIIDLLFPEPELPTNNV